MNAARILNIVVAVVGAGCTGNSEVGAGTSATESSEQTSESTSPEGTITTDPSATAGPTTTSTSSPTTTTDDSTSGTSSSTGLSSTGPGVCGDGFVDLGEECDLGPDNADSGLCTTSCAHASCGDGLLQEITGEACDDGLSNSDAGDCTSKCALAECGDGLLWEGMEECDLGDENQAGTYGGCTPMCTKGPHCGDEETQKPFEECDLGEEKNGEDGEACTAACKLAGKVVFVTSEAYDGALGGLPGADDKCNTLAMEAELANAGSFLAWLSAEDKSPMSRMVHHDQPYLLLDGQTIIADSWTDLTDGSLDAPIMIDELGMVAPDNAAWTGTSASGEPAAPTCKGWTSAKKGDPGLRGLLGAVNEEWSDAAATSCGYAARLICVEQ